MMKKSNDVSVQSLTPSQLQELSGVLKNPISGRQVMISLTTKAFVFGSLKALKNAEDEDMLLVRTESGADLKEMPRQAVYDLLLEEKKRKKEQGKKKTAKPEPPKKEPQAPAKSHTSSAASAPMLPSMAIKEEYDDAGNVVRSEAVNVSKQLELVAKHSSGESKEAEETKESSFDRDGANDGFEVELPVDEKDSTIPVTDEKYRALSDRLDMLARLEEEAGATEKDNALSALKLQSKGWSKGFLGGKATAKKSAKHSMKADPKPKADNNLESMQQPTYQTASSGPNENKQPSHKQKASGKLSSKIRDNSLSGWSKDFLNKKTAKTGQLDREPSAATQTEQLTAHEQVNDNSSKKVSFQSKVEEVREIPRIGQTSVSTMKKPPRPSPPPSSGPGPTRPFDSSVFSGVVKERPVRPMIPGPQQAAQDEKQPKKKLSKFAQERLQGR